MDRPVQEHDAVVVYLKAGQSRALPDPHPFSSARRTEHLCCIKVFTAEVVQERGSAFPESLGTHRMVAGAAAANGMQDLESDTHALYGRVQCHSLGNCGSRNAFI
jgi:hypothetical protein